MCSIRKTIKVLGCKYIKLAKANLRNKNNKILVQTLVLRLGLPESHRGMVLKCQVPITTALIMNKHGSSSSLSINMEPGVHEPFKVYCNFACMYIFFWEAGPEVSLDPHRDS